MSKPLPDASEKTVRRVKRSIKVRTKAKTEAEKIHHLKSDGTRDKRKNKKVHMSPEELQEAHQRQQHALELRMTGMTYVKIAEQLGYSNPSSAKHAVDSVINRTEREASAEVVSLDLARLDEYQMRCTHALRNNGDLGQIDRLMRIMEMRYRLLGVSDETIKLMQKDHGIGGSVTTTNNMVMHVHASPETEEEFIKKMMEATGVNPNSKQAKRLIKEHDVPLALPMLEGSANETTIVRANSEELEENEIVEGEIVEE